MDEITEDINKIYVILKNYLNDVKKHLCVNKALLYGSYATGKYNKHSDVDLAIFIDTFNGMSSIEVNTLLFSLTHKYKDICIEPIGFETKDLEKDNPFIKEIFQTGKVIAHHGDGSGDALVSTDRDCHSAKARTHIAFLPLN